MTVWSDQHAKARFNELLDACQREGPQVVGGGCLLLDTTVVSELRRSRPHGGVVARIESVDDAELYLASVTIGEIQAGIELGRDQDSAQADTIDRWLDQVCNTFNILSMNGPAFRRWAQLMQRQSYILYEDGMIAAIAKGQQLTLDTRHVGDFSPFEGPLLNPFTSRAELGRSADWGD